MGLPGWPSGREEPRPSRRDPFGRNRGQSPSRPGPAWRPNGGMAIPPRTGRAPPGPPRRSAPRRHAARRGRGRGRPGRAATPRSACGATGPAPRQDRALRRDLPPRRREVHRWEPERGGTRSSPPRRQAALGVTPARPLSYRSRAVYCLRRRSQMPPKGVVDVVRTMETLCSRGQAARSGRAVGTRRPTRRHHTGADLAHRLFPGLPVLAGIGEIQLVQHQAGDLGFLVVAGDAIAIEQCLFGRLRLRTGVPPCSTSPGRPKTEARKSANCCVSD